MNYLNEFLTVALLHLLAVMSPGPDFAIITRNSLSYSRNTGIYTAQGIALGTLVHLAYSLIGIGLLISQSIVLFSIVKFIGAAYLIYIGVQSLLVRHTIENVGDILAVQHITPGAALRIGFLTNVLNPKATLFFLSVFTQVIRPATPGFLKVLYGIEISIVTFLWFGIVSFLLSTPGIKTKFVRVQRSVEKAMGAALIALGIRVALSRPA
jgi:RhtB (resistance to homoserine/threonine) family protein